MFKFNKTLADFYKKKQFVNFANNFFVYVHIIYYLTTFFTKNL